MNIKRINYIIICLSIILLPTTITAREPSKGIFPAQVGIKGNVKATNVNLRTGPDIISRSVGYVSNDDIRVVGRYQEWYKVKYQDKDAWINSNYVQVEDIKYVPKVSKLGDQIVNYSKQFIGTPYIWGGTNLKKGVDCSGFIQEIYKRFNIKINRTSYMQVLDGQEISKNNLKKGDLVFFDTNGVNKGNISHVGMYIGEGEFIHSDMSKGISIASLDNSYYKKNYVTAIRIPGV